MARCAWARTDLSIEYHDEEWGVASFDDRHLFEMLILEGAQAGLSWETILRKREGYREAFDGFDIERVAGYGDRKVAELLGNPGIVRNRLKVASAIENAKAALGVIEEEGSLSEYLWSFVDGVVITNRWERMEQVPAVSGESEAMSRALKNRGFRFVGPTIMYAFMQAVGMVNDHLVTCERRDECAVI